MAHDLIRAQVRAGALAECATRIGIDLAHASHQTPPNLYLEEVRAQVGEARRLLDIIEAALAPPPPDASAGAVTARAA